MNSYLSSNVPILFTNDLQVFHTVISYYSHRCHDARMGIIRQVALAVVLISFVVFVALFGRIPALRYICLLPYIYAHG